MVFKATSPETNRVELSTHTAIGNVRLKFQETLEKHFADARQLISIDTRDVHHNGGAYEVAAHPALQFKHST